MDNRTGMLNWRRSSLCANSGCVEVAYAGADWRRSSLCIVGECVEVAHAVDGVAMRDSKNEDGPVLCFEMSDWNTFVSDIKAGYYDDDLVSLWR